jgi:glycosyltransferase involved in cell wall biosynthesis
MPQILSERITSLGLDDNVKMMGYRTDIPQVLAALNVFALPSLREAFGQVATQAMAMERPVVGTAVGGIPEQVINGRTGILVEKANADQLAQGILTLVKNPETASEMGKNGRRLVEQRFSLDAMLDTTEHLYDLLLSEA